LQNMGFRYLWFRAVYELKRKTGLLKLQFPTNVTPKQYPTKAEWQHQKRAFFVDDTKEMSINDIHLSDLREVVDKFRAGELKFFSAKYFKITDWLTNPETGYRYDATKHWIEIADLSAAAGDIKYVWEKSRFSFVYDLIRYDYHTKQSMAAVVFAEIDDWIHNNPINCGPNWRCSQEITLRTLNWIFALYYYQHSPELTEQRLQKILYLIDWQMRHVETNIDFSRIAVRNNHAITETLGLYLVGLLFPFFERAAHWKKSGKKWFEEEIAYQIYEDGTFLQFSMNYHRVVVQLLTWGISLAHRNNDRFDDVVYERAGKSYQFLKNCQDQSTGWLPNYGNNDGALFFKLNDHHFRDYRPQLNALAVVLGQESPRFEDAEWLTSRLNTPPQQSLAAATCQVYVEGGYYVLKEENHSTMTFIRCGSYKDRPHQADALHIDLWAEGHNLLRDAGSYKYNTDEVWVRYFAGTASHNTVMLGGFDQMLKGPRFIWYHWTKTQGGTWTETNDAYVFDGTIKAFAQLKKNITHRRKVTKLKSKQYWVIEDWLYNAPDELCMHQIWHPSPYATQYFDFEAFDVSSNKITASETDGWYSELYSQKEKTTRLVFSTQSHYIKTVFCKKS
jgi:Heparinase II/III-like protein/Heparinase II/III N-terminus